MTRTITSRRVSLMTITSVSKRRIRTPSSYISRRRSAAAAIASFTTFVQGAIVPAHILRNAADFNRSPFGRCRSAAARTSWCRGTGQRHDLRGESGVPSRSAEDRSHRVAVHPERELDHRGSSFRTKIDLVDKLGVTPYSQLGHVPGMIPALGPLLAWEHLAFNTSTGPLQDVRVRRALCEGMNMSEIYAKVVHGVGELGVDSSTRRAVVRPISQTLSLRPARARALLDQAGWRVGGDGMRSKGGVPLQIVFATVAGINRPRADASHSPKPLAGTRRRYSAQDIPALDVLRARPRWWYLVRRKVRRALCAHFMRSTDPGRGAFDMSSRIPPGGITTPSGGMHGSTRWKCRGPGSTTKQRVEKSTLKFSRSEAADVPYVTMRWVDGYRDARRAATRDSSRSDRFNVLERPRLDVLVQHDEPGGAAKRGSSNRNESPRHASNCDQRRT